MLTTKQKLKKLKKAERNLKKKFIGIDKQIKQIINSCKAWYLFPETLNKPLIINLWGITGTFKTSLIRQLIKELDMVDSFVEVDARDLQSGVQPLLGHPNPDKRDMKLPTGFLFDEFQNTRTIDIHGNDTDRADGLAELFSFLSDGQIVFTRSQYKTEAILFQLNRIKVDVNEEIRIIEEFYKEKSTPKRSQVRVVEACEPSGLKQKESEPEDTLENVSFKTKLIYYYDYFIGSFEDLVGRDFLARNFRTPKEALLALVDHLKDFGPTRTFDLSKSLVFVTGNIDEAFRGLTTITDNDYISPDEFYALSSKVNFNQVKSALFYRFKPEQVSRLGSNHVIFPSFNTAMYKALIDSLNKRSISKFKDVKIKIKIDKSVDEFILKHSAIPSQGARSVLSAHEYLVDSNLSEILAETLISGGKEVLIGITDNKVYLINDKKKTIKKSIDIIDLSVLKNYEDKRINHIICTHEAGHGILNVALMGEIPSTIKVRMNDQSVGGYCMTTMPEIPTRREYINYIAICLGGYCAELIDNGYNIDEVLAGSGSDISAATSVAAHLVKTLGLGNSGTITKNGFSFFEDAIITKDNDKLEHEIEDIVNEAFVLALVTLQAMQKEHKALVDILKKNVTVKAKDIAHIFM